MRQKPSYQVWKLHHGDITASCLLAAPTTTKHEISAGAGNCFKVYGYLSNFQRLRDTLWPDCCIHSPVRGPTTRYDYNTLMTSRFTRIVEALPVKSAHPLRASSSSNCTDIIIGHAYAQTTIEVVRCCISKIFHLNLHLEWLHYICSLRELSWASCVKITRKPKTRFFPRQVSGKLWFTRDCMMATNIAFGINSQIRLLKYKSGPLAVVDIVRDLSSDLNISLTSTNSCLSDVDLSVANSDHAPLMHFRTPHLAKIPSIANHVLSIIFWLKSSSVRHVLPRHFGGLSAIY